MSVTELSLDQSVRSPRASRPAVRIASIVVVGVLAVAGVLFVRGWRPFAASARVEAVPVAAGMPSNAHVEDIYGVRLASVAVTAGNGMVQIRYQVLDPVKASAMHDDSTSPVLVRADGTVFDAPGIPGHAHSKNTPEAGRAGYVLLANSNGGIRPGMVVAIRIGAIVVKGVTVL